MSFFFTCLYITFVVLRLNEIWIDYLPPNSLDLIVISAFGFMLVEIARGKLVWPKHLPHQFFILGFYGACMFSDVVWTNLGNLQITAGDIGKIVIVSILILVNVDSYRRIQIVAGVMFAAAFAISIHCYLQQTRGYGFTGGPDAAPLIVYDPNHGTVLHVRSKYIGILGDPNDTSLFMVMTIPFILLLIPVRSFISLGVATAMITPLAYTIYLAGSRGGFLALIMTLFASYAQFLKPRNFTIAALGSVFGIMFLLPSRFIVAGFGQERTMLWGSANQIFKEYPIVGTGYGRIVEYYDYQQVPHNSFVHAYTELGLVGYMFWFSMTYLFLLTHLTTSVPYASPTIGI